MSAPRDPVRCLAIIVEAAREAGVELEAALRFMQLVTMRLDAEAAGAARQPERRQ